MSAVIGLTTLSIAVISAFSARSTTLQQVDDRLLSLRSSVALDTDPAEAAIRKVTSTPSSLLVFLVVDDEAPISLLDGPESAASQSLLELPLSVLRSAELEPQSAGVHNRTRIVALPLDETQWLVLGEAIGEVLDRFDSQLLTNSLVALILALVGGLLAALITDRSTRPLGRIVEYSTAISSGRLEEKLPADAATREIRQLQTAIGTMVESLRIAADAKVRSEANMRVFLADVAHELRTPLTTVRAYADLLAADGPTGPDIRARARERIAHESRRMTRLIDDLLLLARLASTRLSDTSRLDLSELVTAHFSDLRVLDPQRQVDIRCKSCRVEGDRALLERLLANLASNIHRHTPVTARVEVQCQESDGAVSCIVDDAGPGLDEAQMQQMSDGVERFGQLHSGDRHGTGLGLHLVASIARSHGGAALFTRSPLGGLRVSVTLPMTLRNSR